MPTPEDKALEQIDQALEQAGWHVQDYKSANVHAGRGVVLRNFPLVSGHGFADYLLYVDGKAAEQQAKEKLVEGAWIQWGMEWKAEWTQVVAGGVNVISTCTASVPLSKPGETNSSPRSFQARTEVPKALIFAKDASHAKDIVKIAREEFGKGDVLPSAIKHRYVI